MAVAVDTTAANIKPLEGAVVRRYTAGAAVTIGAPVYLDASGYVQMADSDAVATNDVIGVALQAASAAGEVIDVVVLGPVKSMTGATPGALEYTNTAAGQISETAGTKTTIVGVAESATVLFVRPIIVSLS